MRGATNFNSLTSRRSAWTFTVNNCEADNVSFRDLLNHDIRTTSPVTAPSWLGYLVYQNEIGQGGTQHYQGYLQTVEKQGVRGSQVKRWLRKRTGVNAHVEPARGTAAQNLHYCSKPLEGCRCINCSKALTEILLEGRINFPTIIIGKPLRDGVQGKRNDLTKFVELARSRKGYIPERELIEEHSNLIARYPRFTARVLNAYRARPNHLDVYVYWGAAGSGKTYAVKQHDSFYHDQYWVQDTKSGVTYWDGYDGQPVVIIDEMSGSMIKWKTLMNLLDPGTPTKVPVHHQGGAEFVSTTIIFTCNVHPRDWYTTLQHNAGWSWDAEDGSMAQTPLKRRLKNILFFEKDGSEYKQTALRWDGQDIPDERQEELNALGRSYARSYITPQELLRRELQDEVESMETSQEEINLPLEDIPLFEVEENVDEEQEISEIE